MGDICSGIASVRGRSNIRARGITIPTQNITFFGGKAKGAKHGRPTVMFNDSNSATTARAEVCFPIKEEKDDFSSAGL